MTSDILKLRDAVVSDTSESRIRERIQRRADEIRVALSKSGEYRFKTGRGTVVLRTAKKSA